MNEIILKEFKEELANEMLPGNMIAMVEERVFAVAYKGIIFIVVDPPVGFYEMTDEYSTLEEYLEVCNIHSLNQLCNPGEIYNEKVFKAYLIEKGVQV